MKNIHESSSYAMDSSKKEEHRRREQNSSMVKRGFILILGKKYWKGILQIVVGVCLKS
jgi:hypothetical protein